MTPWLSTAFSDTDLMLRFFLPNGVICYLFVVQQKLLTGTCKITFVYYFILFSFFL